LEDRNAHLENKVVLLQDERQAEKQSQGIDNFKEKRVLKVIQEVFDTASR